MIPPLDPFAQKFDSIEIDPSRTPARTAIESAVAHVSPYMLQPETAPGFYLLDDANGRFVVDRAMGVVTVAADDILRSERNTIHAVKLRVIEPSGATYELDMQLRISGRVPQMIGAEEFAAIAGLTDETILVAPRVPKLVVPQDASQIAAAPQTEAVAITPWTRFAPAQGHASRTPRAQARRSFITAETTSITEPVELNFDGLPAPFSAHLRWSL